MYTEPVTGFPSHRLPSMSVNLSLVISTLTASDEIVRNLIQNHNNLTWVITEQMLINKLFNNQLEIIKGLAGRIVTIYIYHKFCK